MKIGIIGLGVVGSAVHSGMRELGHQVVFYDPAKKSEFEDIIDTDICFICVPTPPNKDGLCDTTIVEETLERLDSTQYQGIVAIKSTVVPGTTQRMSELYSDLTVSFVPEFLRERSAVIDFVENHDLCAIGTDSEEVFKKIQEAHGTYPRNFKMLSRTEAEMLKYYNNVYNATLITLANSFYELCEELGVSYTNIKNSLVSRDHINDSYLHCNTNFRGFGGVCLPKDTLAISKLVENLGIDVEFFKMILRENDKYRVTVYEGMRER